MNSEQGDIGEWGIGDLNNQARRFELGGNDCDMEMRLSSPSSEISSKIGRLTSMVYQLGLDEDNLNMPSIPDSCNNRPDFVPVDGTINDMSMYKVPMLDVFEDAQTEPKIQNDPLKLMNKLVERGHTYEICSESNDAPVINEERGLINHELVMGNKHESEKAEDKIGLSEIYRQFSKYGQINERILTKDDLDSMTNNFAVTEAAQNKDLMLSNIPTYVSSEDTGSINDQVKINRTNAEMMWLKCTNASTEVTIGFNDMNFRGGTEESATIGNSFTEKSVSFEDCPVDSAHALAGPSFSQFNEHYTSVCFKEFQPNDRRGKRMEELVCMVCFRTYSPPGHYCVNNWWVPVVPNLNMTIREVQKLLFGGKQVSIPGPSEQINESTSVSTENVDFIEYFYHVYSLSNEAINRNDEGTVSSHNFTTGEASKQSEQGNIMTMRQSFPSSQISTNVFSTG
ncbi:hypothetical protein AVEN_273151-1 [Araneus ventricosus]|uniref:Uncharacterized protein n=1 Tax=Araneus ventricosus TaxID=182803 RepID=A0A4Y2T6F6_ARAVE|nr:hypothetical protein AVEN_273151-1 [Araneus ventricosus]